MSPRAFLHRWDRGRRKELNKNYLLLESGGRIQLEDGSGFILLERQSEGITKDWKMGRNRRI